MVSETVGLLVKRSTAGGEWRVPPVLLAIAGDSGAGKATLTRGLAAALGPDRVGVVDLDDYHRHDRADQRSLPYTALHPKANYLEIADQHLELLARGHPVLKPTYDHRGGVLGRPVLVEPREFVVVEGLLALWSRRARSCYSAAVFLETPEPLRHRWKMHRDTTERGYGEGEEAEELDRREPDAAAFIRPQAAHADIVVRFAPLPGRPEGLEHPLSATVLLRPTIPHPNLSAIVTPEHAEAVALTLGRDDAGLPVDVLTISASAPAAHTRAVQAQVWAALGGADEVPTCLGALPGGRRSEPLVLVQLLLLYHLIQARQA